MANTARPATTRITMAATGTGARRYRPGHTRWLSPCVASPSDGVNGPDGLFGHVRGCPTVAGPRRAPGCRRFAGREPGDSAWFQASPRGAGDPVLPPSGDRLLRRRRTVA